VADVVQITIEGSSAGLVAAANQATSALGQLEQNATKTGGVLSSVFSGIGQGVGIAAGIAGLNGIAGAMGAVGNAAIGLNASLEQSRIGFTSMLGSAEKADAFLRDLQQFAIKTPFEFPELVTASQRMLAFGFAARDVQPLLTAVGSAASAMGTGAEGVSRITTALGQMKAATVVQLGELNQLTEAGVPAFEILAQATGKSTGEVKKLVSQGKIASDVFIDAFQKWSAANFGDMMEKQSHTFQGAMSTIHDAVSMTLANAVQPLFATISAGADTVAQFVSGTDFQTWATALQVGIQGAISSLGSFLSVLAPVGAAISTAFGQFTSGEFAAGFSTIGAAIQTALGQGLAAIQSFATEMFGAGANLVAELAGGIIDAGSSLLTSAVNSVADIIAGFLIGQSPPPNGPLSEIGTGGANTIAAWGEGALGAVDAAVNPVVAAVAGNLDQLKDAGRGADQAIREIGRSIQDLEHQSRDLKNASEDVKRTYDDQIKALDEQIKSIEKAADGTREREKLEMSLEEHMLRQAEVQAMGDPVLRAQLRTRLDALKAQQEERRNAEQLQDAERALSGSRKDQLKDQQDALTLSRQEADLRARLKDAKTPEEKSRIQAQLKELELRKQINSEDARDRQQAAERRLADAQAKKEQLEIQQQLDGLVDKEALARAKSDLDSLHARQEEARLADERARAEAALAAGPLKDERERLIAERDAALKPLQAQLELISRQKEALTEQRQVQQDIKQEITATMQALKEQAKAQADAQKAAIPPGVDRQAYEGDQAAAAAAERAKATGAKLAASIGAGFSDWIHANFAGLAVGALGAVFGGALFGPLGAVAGAYLATSLSAALQERLAGFDIQPLLTKIGDSWTTFWQALRGDWKPPTADEWVDPFVQKVGAFGVDLKQIADAMTPTFQRLGEVIRTAFSGDLTGAIDKLKISLQLTANELAPAIKSWQDGLAQLASGLAGWIVSGAGALDATLTRWFNDAVLRIKWAEIGTALGRSLIGSTQTGLDQAGAESGQLNTAALQAGLGALLQGVITGAWDQTLENWRALAPGESYAAVFVEGLDRGGMVEALMAVDLRLKQEWDRHRAEEFAAFQTWDQQMLAEWNLWLTAQFTAFQTWDVQMLAVWNAWLLSLFTAFQTWDQQQLAEFNIWLKTEFDAFTAWAATMVGGFTTWLADLGTVVSDGWNAIWARTGEAWDAIWALITQKAADIAGQFTNMVAAWVQAGTDMATGLVKAVGDGLAALAETVLGPIKSTIETVKGLLNFGGGGGTSLGQGGGRAMRYKDLIEKVSNEEKVPANRLAALIDVEDSGETSVSSAGARGIMQVVPGQGYDLPGEDASDPETSIRQGARALRDKYNRTGSWDEAGAAYFGYGRDAGGMDTNTYRSRYLAASERYAPTAATSVAMPSRTVPQVNQFSLGLPIDDARAACGPAVGTPAGACMARRRSAARSRRPASRTCSTRRRPPARSARSLRAIRRSRSRPAASATAPVTTTRSRAATSAH
jgi:tape measure domain-containing protein